MQPDRAIRTLMQIGLAFVLTGPALAQGTHDAGAPPASASPNPTPLQRAERRFPQPVRVGDLYNRQVLEPSDHQGVLGRVDKIVRTADGHLLLVVRFGGVLGYGTRVIAVPIETMTLLGQFMEIVDLTDAQLQALPTFAGTGTIPVGLDEVIRVGLSRN